MCLCVCVLKGSQHVLTNDVGTESIQLLDQCDDAIHTHTQRERERERDERRWPDLSQTLFKLKIYLKTCLVKLGIIHL